jgi:hypothetical protein
VKALGEHAPAVPAGLAAYFEAMEDVVFGGVSPDALREALGPSPSSNARFDFYRQLAHANPRRTLRGTFRAAEHLCDQHAEGLFNDLIERHFAANPPSGWELTRVCDHFDATVQAAAEVVSLPAGLDEVVDYETLRQRVLFYELDAPVAGQPHPSCEVRSYTFDVPAFATAVRQAEDAAAVRPSGGAVTCLFHRHPTNGRLMTRNPAVAHLVVIALASGEADESVIAQAGLTPDQVDDARAELVRWGAFVAD